MCVCVILHIKFGTHMNVGFSGERVHAYKSTESYFLYFCRNLDTLLNMLLSPITEDEKTKYFPHRDVEMSFGYSV